MNEFLIVMSGFITSICSYIVWPSRFNVLAHSRLGFGITGLIIPVYLADVLSAYNKNIVADFALISFCGAVFYLLGVLFGFHYKIPGQNSFRLYMDNLKQIEVSKFLKKYTTALTLSGVLLMLLCFAGMGFIPALSSDPFQAKFFRGEYKTAYQPFALPYRISYQIISLCSVITLALYLITKKKKYILLAMLCSFFLLLTLTRGPTLYAVILFFGCLVAFYTRWFWPYILFIVVIYPLGSLFYLIIGSIFGLEQFAKIYDLTSIWSSIASGAPDVTDQLDFLNGFVNLGSELTYGKTFVGGLVPYNYFWNPSVYSLYIVNGGLLDISSLSSGGVRVGLQLSSYSAFAWPGVIIVSFISGTIWGISTKIVKYFVEHIRSTTQDKPSKAGYILLAILIYESAFRFLSDFYSLSLYGLATLLLISILLYGYRFRKKSTFSKQSIKKKYNV